MVGALAQHSAIDNRTYQRAAWRGIEHHLTRSITLRLAGVHSRAPLGNVSGCI
jgi:hypothetical protein